MEDLKKFGDSFSLLVIAPIESLQNEICNIIKQFKNIPCIYIALNKPYTTIENMLKKQGCKKEDIYFIDCISSKIKAKNATFVESPSALTTISISMTKLLEKIKGDKLLVVDSLSTFLIYNDINTVARFVSSTIQKNKNKLIMFTPKEKDKTLIEKVGPFFDEIIGL